MKLERIQYDLKEFVLNFLSGNDKQAIGITENVLFEDDFCFALFNSNINTNSFFENANHHHVSIVLQEFDLINIIHS